MDSGENITVAILEVVDCKSRLYDGKKKYDTFICNQFLKHMKGIDPIKQLLSIVMLDGDLNVQLSEKKN